MKKVRLERLHIKNFRGIKDLSFEGFGGVNVLLGPNNVGKSSILEAIVLSSAPSDVTKSTRLDGYARGFTADEIYRDLTYLGVVGKNENLFLKSIWNNGEERTTTLSLESSSNTHNYKDSNLIKRLDRESKKGNIAGSLLVQPFSVKKNDGTSSDYYSFCAHSPERSVLSPERRTHTSPGLRPYEDERLLDENISVFLAGIIDENRGIRPGSGDIFDNKDIRKRFVDCLKIFDKEIQSIEIDTRRVKVDLKRFNHWLPITSMGNGFIRTFQILFNFFSRYAPVDNPEAILFLIDEIENGLHYSKMPEIIGFLLQLSKELGIQLFIATHSVDVLKAFRRVLLKDEYARFRDELNVFTLATKGSRICQDHFQYDALSECIEKGIEMRG